MKRNNELIFHILQSIESEDHVFGDGDDNFPKIECDFHIQLLIDAGFIKRKSEAKDEFIYLPFDARITWDGYEFIEKLSSGNFSFKNN